MATYSRILLYRSKCKFAIIRNIFNNNKRERFCNHQSYSPLITVTRPFLTEAYKCNDLWEKRFQAPLLQNVKSEELFFEIDKKFSTKKKVSAIDIDLFAHSVTSAEDLPELEHVLHSFRRSKATACTLESTHYAVVRAFVELDGLPALLNILNDRVGYGVFPDHYGYNMILDKLLEQENYRDATKVAILMMIQEDFSNPIGAVLALHACHMYLQKPQPEPWDPTAETQTPAENDEEEVFIRIPYLRNPYFDDHFDIKDPAHLIGKTLYMVGKEHNDVVGRSYQLIGLGMHEKWEKCIEFLDQSITTGKTVLEESVNKFNEILEKATEDEQTVAIKERVKEKVGELVQKKCIESGSLNDLMTKKLESIKQYEILDIEAQKELFDTWQEKRQKMLDEDLFKLAQMEMKTLIEKKRLELEQKEQELFFFENWDKHHMELVAIEEYEKTLKTTTTDDENYIPPEVRGSRPS